MIRSDATTPHQVNLNLGTDSTDCWLGPSGTSQITGAGNATFKGTIAGGANGGTGGQLNLNGATSCTVTVQPQAAARTWNFNLPIAAGTSGQALTSAGGGSSPMTWNSFPSIIPMNSIGGIPQNATSFFVNVVNAAEGKTQAICPRSGTFKNAVALIGGGGTSAGRVRPPRLRDV